MSALTTADRESEARELALNFAAAWPTPNVRQAIAYAEAGVLGWSDVAALFGRGFGLARKAVASLSATTPYDVCVACGYAPRWDDPDLTADGLCRRAFHEGDPSCDSRYNGYWKGLHTRCDGRQEVEDLADAEEAFGCQDDPWCILRNGHDGACCEDRERP